MAGYSGPHTFTGKAPSGPREDCQGCPAHDWLARPAHRSCALRRLQHGYWTAAENYVLRPFSSLCREGASVRSVPSGPSLDCSESLLPFPLACSSSGRVSKPLHFRNEGEYLAYARRVRGLVLAARSKS